MPGYGKTLTPEDVLASIAVHVREGTKSAANSLFSQVSEMQVDGDNVVFTLAGGNADFPFYFADLHLYICPSKDEAVDWQSGVGAGAYQLDGYRAVNRWWFG